LPAEVVMADTAYDADHLRKAIAAKGALAQTTRHVRSNIRSTSISMHSAISSNAASQSSSSSGALQPASRRPREITAPSSLSQRSCCGCDKCPHYLGLRRSRAYHRAGGPLAGPRCVRLYAVR
jgi:hypothetical protein